MDRMEFCYFLNTSCYNLRVIKRTCQIVTNMNFSLALKKMKLKLKNSFKSRQEQTTAFVISCNRQRYSHNTKLKQMLLVHLKIQTVKLSIQDKILS